MTEISNIVSEPPTEPTQAQGETAAAPSGKGHGPPSQDRPDNEMSHGKSDNPQTPAPAKAAPKAGRGLLRMLDAEGQDDLNAIMAQFDKPGLFGSPASPDRPKAEQHTAINVGEKKAFRVISLHGGDVFVDLGEKSEGMIPAAQFGDKIPAIGDLVDLIVDRYDRQQDIYRLRVPGAAQEADWGTVTKGMVVDAMVRKANKGGLEVTVNGLRGFLPAGQVDIVHVPDLTTLVGKTLRCEVFEVSLSEKNLVVSRRIILERERAELAKRTLESLEVGQVRDGVVKKLMDFGAFVDIGGVDGLVHIGQMSWTRVAHPSEVLSVGQPVRVTVLTFDKETKKIGFGLRQLSESPWTKAAEKFPIGAIVTGRVSRLADFGAFVELEPAIDGLIHISELSNRRVRRVTEVVQEGQTVEVKILACDVENQRISLSLKQAVAPVAEPVVESADGAAPPEGAANNAASEAPPPEPEMPKRKISAPLKGGLGGGSGPLFG